MTPPNFLKPTLAKCIANCYLFVGLLILPTNFLWGLQDNKFYWGGGAAFFWVSEISPTQDYRASYSAPGAQLEVQYRGEGGYNLAASLGMHRLTSLTYMGRPIELASRSQWFFPLQTSLFTDLTPNLALGGGLDLFSYGPLYFNGSPTPNSAGLDLYGAFFLQWQQPLTDTLDWLTHFRLGLNLTPGNPEFVGLNNLLATRWSCHFSLLYRVL